MRFTLVGMNLILLLVSSCAEFPFSVRESELPTGTATNIPLTTQPEMVISNLVNAVNEQDVFDYAGVFSEDFVFVADPEDVLYLENFYPGVFSDWDLKVEKRVAQYILDQTRTSFAQLEFVAETEIERTDSTYVVDQEYSLILAIESVKAYKGTARFFIKRGANNLWYMHRWEDSRSVEADKDTWGMIKGEIRGTT